MKKAVVVISAVLVAAWTDQENLLHHLAFAAQLLSSAKINGPMS